MVLASVPDSQWLADVGPVPGVDLVPWSVREPLGTPESVELVVLPYLDGEMRMDLLAGLPRLAVVQLLSAGYEDVAPHVPAGVRLCNAGGVHDASTAELAVTLLLASLRGVPAFVEAQQQGRWLPSRIWPALADRRVLVVGYGHVGRAVVRRLLPFAVTVTAVASRARPGDDLVEQVHAVDELPGLLPHHDVVVVITPLTPQTEGLVDRGFLAAMPDGAVLVNVARGRVADTEALLAEAASGRLRVAVDVTDPEPLPADHALWRTPGVLVSPHVGGATTAFRPRAVALLRAQLEAYAAGRELSNVVAG